MMERKVEVGKDSPPPGRNSSELSPNDQSQDSHSSLLHEVSGPQAAGSASVMQERKC